MESAETQAVNPAQAPAVAEPDWAAIKEAAASLPDNGIEPKAKSKAPEGAPDDGQLKTLPEPRQAQRTKEESIAERIRQKNAKAAAKAKLAPVEQQLQQRAQQLDQAQREWQQRQQALQDAAKEGRLDQVLKQYGLPSVSEYNRAVLTKKGAVAPIDPEIAKQLDELKQYKAQQEKARQEAIAQQRQAQAQRQQAEEMQGLASEVESLGIPEATSALGLPGFTQQLYAAISDADDDLSLEQAVSDTMSRYRGLYDTLSSIFSDGSTPDLAGDEQELDPPRRSKGRNQGRSRRSPTSSLSQFTAAEAGARRPMSKKDEWAAIVAQAARLN